MSSIENPTVYDDLLDVLAEGADLDRLLTFRLPKEKQARLDALLERNREGQLSDEDVGELDTFEHIEHVVGGHDTHRARDPDAGALLSDGVRTAIEARRRAAIAHEAAHPIDREALDQCYADELRGEN